MQATSHQAWTDEEIKRIDGIDGYFCALISGANVVSPPPALRWVYGSDAGEEPGVPWRRASPKLGRNNPCHGAG